MPVFLVGYQRNYSFLDRFSKDTYVQNFIKMRPVGADLFRTDGRKEGRTDRHAEANIRFSQFRSHIKTAKLSFDLVA